MKLILPIYKENYENILPTYRLYKRTYKILLVALLIIMVTLSVFLADRAKILSLLNIDLYHIIWIVALVIIISSLLIFAYFPKKFDEYALTREQLAFIHAYKAIENIENYTNKRLDVFRRRALKNLSNLSLSIDNWNGGNLKVTKNLIENELKSFQNWFDKKVLSIAKNGNKQDLKKLTIFLLQLLGFLMEDDPKIRDLTAINKHLQELREITIGKIRFLDKLSTYFEKFVLIKHIIVGVGIFAFCAVLYFFGIYILNINKDYVFLASVAALVSFI